MNLECYISLAMIPSQHSGILLRENRSSSISRYEMEIIGRIPLTHERYMPRLLRFKLRSWYTQSKARIKTKMKAAVPGREYLGNFP